MPRSVVPILRAPRSSSESASSARWCGRIRCARSESSRLSPISTPSAASSSISFSSATGSTTTPLPITHRIPGCRIPEGTRCSTKLLAAHDDRVAGVVAAVVAGDDLDPRRQEVDDLALAFVAPLGAAITMFGMFRNPTFYARLRTGQQGATAGASMSRAR